MKTLTTTFALVAALTVAGQAFAQNEYFVGGNNSNNVTYQPPSNNNIGGDPSTWSPGYQPNNWQNNNNGWNNGGWQTPNWNNNGWNNNGWYQPNNNWNQPNNWQNNNWNNGGQNQNYGRAYTVFSVKNRSNETFKCTVTWNNRSRKQVTLTPGLTYTFWMPGHNNRPSIEFETPSANPYIGSAVFTSQVQGRNVNVNGQPNRNHAKQYVVDSNHNVYPIN